MATALEVQAELDAQGTGKKIVIIKGYNVMPANTTVLYYCTGGTVAPGKARWCAATVANTAAQQATSITNAMTA
jgi:hypothetical protein